MNTTQHQPDRRRFFGRVITAIHAGIAATLGVMLGGAAVSPALTRREENWVPAGGLGELPAGEPMPVVLRVPRQDGYAYVIDQRTIFLVRTDAAEIIALDSTCTHLGCRVSWDRENEQLRCPCHGGVYDRHGQVVSGPPPAPLARIDTRVDGNRVLVRV